MLCTFSDSLFLLYDMNTVVVLGTAGGRKATQSTRSTLCTLGLNALPLLLTTGLSPSASERLRCCSARPLRLYPLSALRRAALATPRTHRRAVFCAACI